MSTPSDMLRYVQQIKLNQIGLAGQGKLKQARVLCIGAGGLGCSLLMYLAAAGVGQIGIVDEDQIEESNLHRQVLYQQKHVHQKKSVVAGEQLRALNPLITVQIYDARFTRENANALIEQYDIIADCTDNFSTRYLIHEVCFRLGKPYVYASAYQFLGHCSVFYGKHGPCLCCIFPAVPSTLASCEDGGVLGVLPGILGMIQAAEIIKWILTIGHSLEGRLLMIDLLAMKFQEIQLTKNSDCPLCAHGLKIKMTASLSKAEIASYAITAEELSNYLLEHPETLLLDVRTPEEHAIKNLGGTLIPLSELTLRLNELDPTQSILVYCHSGPRSIQALTLLLESGFKQVRYLAGGVQKLFS